MRISQHEPVLLAVPAALAALAGSQLRRDVHLALHQRPEVPPRVEQHHVVVVVPRNDLLLLLELFAQGLAVPQLGVVPAGVGVVLGQN